MTASPLNVPRIRGSQYFALLFWFCALAFPAWAQTAPDLTAVDLATIDRSRTYNLGPTGLRGWVYTADTGQADQTPTHHAPWQILVTTVGANTPAVGILQPNDVILGARGGGNLPVPLFSEDARKSFGQAIGDAEAADGSLHLKRWRAGQTADVTLQLQVLGAYASTAPYNCPKTELILSNAIAVLKKVSLDQNRYNILGPVQGLAMLATGDPVLREKALAHARRIAPTIFEWPDGRQTWSLGFEALFLGESYLATGDGSLLDGLAGYLEVLSTHQTRLGTYGHGLAVRDPDPAVDHTLGGYGALNAAGVPANLAIVVGRRALHAAGRAVNPEVDAAIERSSTFFAYYSGKGSVPYGEHEPWDETHGGNGKESSTAVLFGLLPDRSSEAEYFSRLSTSGFYGHERGHSGPGLAQFWSPLGANVGGPAAAAAYFREVRWHLDLSRRSDGSFAFNNDEGAPPFDRGDYWATYDYAGAIDATALHVLTYALGRAHLLITGKANPVQPRLTEAQVTNAVWAGRFVPNRKSASDDQLLAALSEYDPVVRANAAKELGTRPGANRAALLALAKGADPRARAAAIDTLGRLRETAALPTIIAALDDPDVRVRQRAGTALGWFQADALPQLNAAFAALVRQVPPTDVYPEEDPLQHAQLALRYSLFGNFINPSQPNLGVSLATLPESPLRNAALRAGLRDSDSLGRATVAFYFHDRATLDQVHAAFPELARAAVERVPVDVMWDGEVSLAVFSTLLKHRIAEGIPLAVEYLERVRVGEQFRHGDSPAHAAALNLLAAFGDEARWTLPDLERLQSANALEPWVALILNSTLESLRTATSPGGPLVYSRPQAPPQTYVGTGVQSVTLRATTPRTGELQFTVLAPPAHGSLSGPPPTFSYTPKAGFVGIDRITYQAADNVTESERSAVFFVVGEGGSGLRGEYFVTPEFNGIASLVRTDTRLAFDSSDAELAVRIPAESRGVRWTGRLLVPESADYQFSVLHNGAVRLWVDGQLLLDTPNLDDRRWSDDDRISLRGGRTYELRLEYTRGTPDAVLKLKWSGPEFAGRAGALIGTEWLFPPSSGPNVAPVAFPQDLAVNEDTPTAVTLEGGDTNHHPLTFAVVALPAHGTLSGTAPNLTYTPAANYHGPDAFTFWVNDGTTNSATATVAVTVTPIADVALANSPAEYAGPAATTATLKAVLASDTAGVELTAFWGFADGGTDPEAWEHSATVGIFPAGIDQIIQHPVSNLTAQRRYFFTFRAVPTGGTEIWPVVSQHFGPASEKELLTFGLPGFAGQILGTSVVWELPVTNNLAALAPILSASPGATVEPPSGTLRDFSVQQAYTVTAENGEQATYYVTALLLPASHHFWSLGEGDWSDPLGWVNDLGASTPLTAGGSPERSLRFERDGTYTARNNLPGTFELNRLAIQGASVTLAGNPLNFVTSPAGELPQLNQEGATPVRIDLPIGLGNDLVFRGQGTGTVTLRGLIGSGQTTDGALVHAGSHLLYLDTPNRGFAGGLTVSNATLRVTVGERTLGSEPNRWGPGDTAKLRLANAQLELEGYGIIANWHWAVAGTIELSGTNRIRSTTTDGTYLRGDLQGSGLLILDGQYPLAMGRHSVASTYSGDVRVLSTNVLALDGTQPFGSGGTVTVAAPGGARLGIASSNGASLENDLQLETGVTLAWSYNEMEFAFNRRISGPGGITKSFDAADRGTHVVLRQANTYSGGTRILSGRLEPFLGGSLGTGPVTLGGKASPEHSMAFVNRTLMTVANPITLIGVNEPELSDAQALTEFLVDPALTLSGPVTGSGGLLKTGPGELTLSGPNEWTGPTVVRAGTLVLSSSLSLGRKTALTVSAGAHVRLNFNGKLPLASLVLDGANLPPGIYSANSHPNFFTGSGVLDLRGPGIHTQPIAVEAATSQTLRALLISDNLAAQVVAYWGPVNGGNNPAAWAHTAQVGSYQDVYREIAFLATGLSPSTTYHFTFRANIGGNDFWAAEVGSFTTQAADSLPQIVTPPQPLTVIRGTTARFTVAATGSSLSYRWYRNDSPLFFDDHLDGIHSTTLEISEVTPADAGEYYVVVSKALGSAASSKALLTVIDPPSTFLVWDANGSGAGRKDGTGTWDHVAPNWWNGTANEAWIPGQNARIGSAGSGGTITLGDVIATRVTIGNFNAPDYQLTGGSLTVISNLTTSPNGTTIRVDSSLKGPGSLVHHGPGNLFLFNPENSYTGGTLIDGGILVSAALEHPVLGLGPVTVKGPGMLMLERVSVTNSLILTNGQVLANNGFGAHWHGPVELQGRPILITPFPFELHGPIAGTGTLIKRGDQVLRLSGINSGTGDVQVEAGQIEFLRLASVGSGELSLAAGTTASLAFDGEAPVSSLRLNGTTQPQGTYGSLTSTAANRSASFLGSGVLRVGPAASIENRPPTFGDLGLRNVAEGDALDFFLPASDPDLPAQPLLFDALSPLPLGLTVNAGGRVYWQPSEAQGPNSYVVRVRVTDGRASTTNEFTVNVTEINRPPRLLPIPNQTLADFESLGLFLVATDLDVPPQPLSFRAVAGPAGLTVSSSGFLHWTPEESQSPGVYPIQVAVSDGLASVTNAFTVVVNEVNTAPVLTLTEATALKSTLFQLPLNAFDADLPSQTLTYTLTAPAPTGLTLTPTGLLGWTPTPAQSPSTNLLRIVVSDGVVSTTNALTLFVRDSNVAPVFPAFTEQVINEGVTFNFQIAATDADVPQQNLSYRLASPGPTGLTLNAKGALVWTPSENQGPSTNVVQVAVTDGLLSVTNALTIVVREVNTAPNFPALADRTVDEGVALNLQLAATDNDLPAQTLVFSLATPGPAGLTLSAAGALAWTPTKAQGPGTNVVRVAVTDGFTSVTNALTIVVREVNVVPELTAADVRLTGDTLEFVIRTTRGYRYRLVFSPDLKTENWQPLVRPPLFPPPDGWSAPSDGSPLRFVESPLLGPVRLYRLEQFRP